MPREACNGQLRVSLVLHSFDQGGSGRVAAYLAHGLAERGFDIDVVVFAGGGPAQAAAAAIIGDGIPVHYFGRKAGFRPFDLLRGLSGVTRHLHGRRPNVVIAAANNVALFAGMAVRLARLRESELVLKTTNPIASSRHRGVVRMIRRWSYRQLFRRSSAVWTLSSEESHEMREAFPEFAGLFHDVANPYVTPAMLAVPATAVMVGSTKTVISVARLTAQKRLERLIGAFAKVRHPDARLVILGEGEERESLTALAMRLGIADRVAMPGYVSDVASALHNADLFVLPSDYEGLPAVVLEAMAANCPVLSTDCFPAARSLLAKSEGCAIIPDGDNASALADMIDEHLQRPRPTHLRAVAERFSIANGLASHAEALLALRQRHNPELENGPRKA